MTTGVSLIVAVMLYGVFGFLVYFLGSRLSKPALSWKASLLLAAVAVVTVCGVVNIFVPLWAVLFALIVSLTLLIAVFRCKVLASLAMTVVSLFVPALIIAYLNFALGTPTA